MMIYQCSLQSKPKVQYALDIIFLSVLFRTRCDTTSGNGANRIVVMKAAGAVDAEPVDGSSYTGNSNIGNGSH